MTTTRISPNSILAFLPEPLSGLKPWLAATHVKSSLLFCPYVQMNKSGRALGVEKLNSENAGYEHAVQKRRFCEAKDEFLGELSATRKLQRGDR